MPSVGMRRTTRVFGARVLRSGRRLWSVDNSVGADVEVKGKDNGWRRNGGLKQDVTLMDIDEKKSESKSKKNVGSGLADRKQNADRMCGLKQDVTLMDIDEKKSEPKSKKNAGSGLAKRKQKADRMCGSVYKRKRRRVDLKNSHSDGSLGKKRALEDKKYGKQFIRKRVRTKRIRESTSCCPVTESSVSSRVFAAINESSSCGGNSRFSCVLSLVLRYMCRTELRLLQLYAFVSSEPLALVFSSHGICFSLGCPPIKSSGICKIFGARRSAPLFSIDFSAAPVCFMSLHSTLLLRSVCFPYVFATHSNMEDDSVDDVLEHVSCISGEGVSPGKVIVTSVNDNSGRGSVLYATTKASELAGRALQVRNGVNSRRVRKRRRSNRYRRVKKTAFSCGRKANGSLVSNLVSPRRVSTPLVPLASDRKLRSSVRENSIPNIKLLKSSLVGLTQNIGSSRCAANILVIESDKCYRIEDAIVKLESSSKQWLLAVKKDGMTLYSLTAQKVMRPCSCNRVTHDIIWTEDTKNWKLEFPERRDWLVFKELYRVCSDRNVKAPTSRVIPVPGASEVLGYADSVNIPFRRPISYISVKDDELSRALAKRVANYDMDSEDEEWLREFNNGSSAASEHWEHVSEESFELKIDNFEKALYCSQAYCSAEKAAVSPCLDAERKGVVEAIYSYWVKKRKQRDSALIRVFQCYQHRIAHLHPKPIIRKRRSIKRQPCQPRRIKQQTFMQAITEKQDALEEQNALRKVEETKAAASRSEGVAIEKRQKAQLLMESADLAAYKAAMALQIAEAAHVAESADAVASFLLY